ncbi:BspA family leucine-rich repeat surface protein, partial [Lactobacillus ultunensis]|uniref:BspA family leucine-rich repeat surface protein n=1 Tax=Lactobacillus ultunensis TaxID=227945 RepID=UPI00138F54A7
MDNWHATVNGNYLDIDKYFPAIDRGTDPHGSLNLGDNSNKRNTNIIIPNADDFAAHHTADNLSGTWRSGLQTRISSTVTEKIINELNPYSIAFSKTGNNQNTILKDNYNGGNYGAFAANRHSISNLTNFDGTNLDVSNIHDFGGMFINDSKLNDDSLKTIKGWDVSNRETLSIGNSFFGMFAGDTSLHDLTPLKIWKIGKNSRGSDDTTPINVASMFNFGPNDGKTIYADISKWNLKSVKNLVDGMDISGMYEMFDDSSNHAIRVNVENMPNWEWTKETLDGSAWGVPSINNESIFSHPASKNLIFLVHSAPLSPSIPPVLSPEPENTIKIGTVTTNSPVFVSDMNDIIDPVTNDRYSVESGEWYGVQDGKAVGLALAYARDILRTKIVNWHRNNTLQDKELLIDQSDQNDAIATLNANLEKQEIDGGLINTPVNSDPAIYAGIKARSERDTQTLSQLGSEAYEWQLENITSSGSVIPSSSATKKDGTLEYTGKVKSKFDPEKSVEVKVTVRVTGGREKLVSKKASEVGSIDNNGLNDWAKATIANAGSLESRTNHTDSWFADNTFQWVKENPSGSFNINGSNYSVIGSIDELLESINSSNPDFEVGTPSTYSTYSENPVSINGRNYNNVKKGYVMITYHKPNVADSEHPIVYSRQIVEVPVQIATDADNNT